MLTYVVPLRRWRAEPMDELARYLEGLADWVEVIVVDGSDADLFSLHHARLGPPVRHLPPHADLRGRNGKVNGVMTGVREAAHERIVVADDDVRYDLAPLESVAGGLLAADVVRPQNYFEPLPWHARWDTARSLLNRAFHADYPGTLGLRRSALLVTGGYDGDVLFENLELMRTVAAVGGRVLHAPDIYVRRLPPSPRHFWHQRVRQAYDSFATPARFIAELGVLPLMVWALRRHRPLVPLGLAGLSVVAAERGRRRWGGRAVYPATSALWAPLWGGERAVCAWWALGARARGGVRYAGTRVRRAATTERALRRRWGPGRPLATLTR